MRKPSHLFGAALGLCLISSAGHAQEAEDDEADAQLPDVEMLEFLGQFATDEGGWIDPDSLLSDEFGVLLDAAIENQPSTNESIAEPEND